MIRAPHILLLGAAGQNQGKSTLACRIIERHANKQPVLGAKITTIRERGGVCPRGGEGCGVCQNLKGDWELTEETGENPTKDTGRMLAAGAEQVFWLRVCQARLEEGVRALLERIAGRPVVCEGNSPRLVLHPGAFLVSEDPNTTEMKPTAAAVQQYVDQKLTFDGTTFDPPEEDIGLSQGRWSVKRRATAVIMAGGKSRRMGRDKSLLDVGGKPLIAHIVDHLRPHFAEVVVSANEPAKYAFLDLPIVPDREPEQGPLMGIVSTLDAAHHEQVFVLATDIPEPDLSLMESLLRHQRGHDAAVPRYANGYLEPLFAVYGKSFVATADAALARGQRAVRATFNHCDVLYLDLAADNELVNLNTPEDLLRFRKNSI